jgi:Na+/serine symporter
MARLRIAGLALAAILLLIIVFENTAEATFKILILKVTMPLALLLGVMLFSGMAIGWLSALWVFRKNPPPPKP